MCLAGVTGWLIGGRILSRRVAQTMDKKYIKEQKSLYTQYYNDVYKLQEQNAELALAIQNLQEDITKLGEKRDTEALQRDYDEFKQPDVDDDDRISHAEFNMYVKNFLSNYPGLSEKDYPKFDDFDHDKDGYVSFKEYSRQMAKQVKNEEKKQFKKSRS